MKKRFAWLFLMTFVIAVSIMACGGTSSDVAENPVQQIEESEKQGIGITFMDPNPYYPNNPECASRQRALADSEREQVKLGENDYLVTGENQISDSAGNLTIDELQRKFEGTLTSSDLSGSDDNLGEETDRENLGAPVSEESLRNLFWIDETRCPLNLFCVNVHGLEYHELRPCVDRGVWHINIALMKNRNDPKTKYWANFHIGAYKNSAGRICIVLFEQVTKSKNMRICKEICAPSRKDLEKALNQAMTEVLASAKINVSAVAISTAAVILSYLIYSALMAAAV